MKKQNPKRQGVLRRFRWGLLFALVYLVTAVVSYFLYRADRHEYSIPMFIFIYSSYPVYIILVEVLRPIRIWAHSELLLVSMILLFTTVLYFAIGQAVGNFFRNIIRDTGKIETRSTPKNT
ncbi:MAG: hypothetical protein OEW48_18210 [Phycisphaerae bacterium]|nr:hypothetical protein [Phycisphaerae bacterium]